MPETSGITTIFIVLSVLFFVALIIAMMVIVDHKARLPGGKNRDPWSIAGKKKDHPGLSFVTASILLSIIAVLVLEVAIVFIERLNFFSEEETHQGLIHDINHARFSNRQRHFHNIPEVDLISQGEQSVCFSCHGDYPHSKEPLVSSMMNMHTQFIGCLTCHVNEEKIPESSLQFAWLNYSGIDVSGVPYGSDINEETGALIDTDDYYSKIVAYTVENGEQILLEIPSDTPYAQEYLAVKDRLSDLDQEAVKKRFHKGVKGTGKSCSRCHTTEENAYLPFNELGFSQTRITELTNLNIVGIVENYRDFYMPNLFNLSSAKKQSKVKSGKPVKNDTTDKEYNGLEQDPKSWWKKHFDSRE